MSYRPRPEAEKAACDELKIPIEKLQEIPLKVVIGNQKGKLKILFVKTITLDDGKTVSVIFDNENIIEDED